MKKNITLSLIKTLMTYLGIICLSFFTINSLNAQTTEGNKCGTDEQMQNLYDENPNSLNESIALRQSIASESTDFGMPPPYVIPVVFHVFGTEYNNGTTVNLSIIQDALDKTNEDFKGLNADYVGIDAPFDAIKQPLDITFKLAQLDPNGNPTTGVIFYDEASGMGNYGNPKVPQVAWDNYKYCNIYITRDLYGNGAFNESGVAWYPDTYMSDNNLARITYNGSYLGSNTDENFRSVLTHEFGHWLDLPHTFANNICSSNPADGDGVADTPSLANNSSGANCSVIQNCLNEEINNENFMDYDCYKMFTQGQVARMVNALDNSPARNTLWTSANLTCTGLDTDLGTRIIASSNTYGERYENDGIIESTIDLTCSGCTFSASSGDLALNTDYTVANLPNGLTSRITLTSNTTAQIHLDGTATAHELADSITNLNFTFLDPMVTGGVAQLYNSGLSQLSIDFLDVYTEYCDVTIGYAVYTHITEVNFNGTANASGYDGITNYTQGLAFPARQGDTYPISITTNKGNGGAAENERIQVWADWNKNFIYEDSELVMSHPYNSSAADVDGNYTHASNITIPVDTDLGTTSFRVMAHYVQGTDGDTPCTYIDSGETEDYGLLIYDENATFEMEFSSNRTVVNFSEPVNFLDLTITDSGDSVTSWLWTFENGVPNTSTDQNPTNILFPDAGTYDVTLNVITNNGTNETITKVDYITSELNYCDSSPNFGSYFNVNHVNFETIDHSPGLSNSYDYFDTVFTSASTGETYPITITTEKGNGGAGDTNRVRVWVDWNYDSVFSEDELIISENVTFDDYDAGGEYSFTSNITVPYNASVGNKVGLRIIGHYLDGTGGETSCGQYDSGNTADYGLNITAGAPGIVANATTSSNSFPVTDTVNFQDASSSSDTLTSWVWSFPGGTPSTHIGQVPPAISYENPGVYNYSLTVEDSENRTDTYNGTIEAIYQLCDVTQSFATYGHITNVTLDNIDNTTGYDGTTSYFDTYSPTAELNEVVPFSVTLNTGNSGNSDDIRLRMWIDWNYNSAFEPSELVHTETINVATVGGANVNHVIPASFTVPNDAHLDDKIAIRTLVHYVDSSSAGDMACGELDSGEVEDYGITISNSLSTEDPTTTPFSIYPNPTKGDLYIQSVLNDEVNIELYNMLGQVILSEKMQPSNGNLHISLRNFQNGIYILSINQGKTSSTVKIIVNK